MTIGGKPHPHSFFRDGNHTRVVEAVARRGAGISIRSGLNGLSVFKSTGSAFYGFVRDEYTTLSETRDRILSTDVDAVWEWRTFTGVEDVQNGVDRFNAAWEHANKITMDTFANDDSASVQATMFKMAERILVVVPEVNHVEYSLPNKHYFEIGMELLDILEIAMPIELINLYTDLSWHKGIKNTGENAEVYAPQTTPNGLIKCRVTRSDKAKL